jgi:hypothetical protein
MNEPVQLLTKYRNKIVEVRQTIHPKYVTEMLMGILRGVGHSHEVERIEKRTRDDVLCECSDPLAFHLFRLLKDTIPICQTQLRQALFAPIPQISC